MRKLLQILKKCICVIYRYKVQIQLFNYICDYFSNTSPHNNNVAFKIINHCCTGDIHPVQSNLTLC